MAKSSWPTIAEIKKMIKRQQYRVNEENARLYDLQLWLKEKEDYKEQQKENKLKESLKRKIKKIK